MIMIIKIDKKLLNIIKNYYKKWSYTVKDDSKLLIMI